MATYLVQKDTEFLHYQSLGQNDLRNIRYDVTSTYLEGQCNDLAAFGYNRDGKRGKRQLVVGLVTDGEGEPLSVEVFRGNTADPKTVESQVRKIRDRWGGADVVLVGDRGMIRGPQQELLKEEGLHYITALTRPTLENLVDGGVIQLGLFDEKLAVVELECGVRYVLRRNPVRAAETAAKRQDRLGALETRVQVRNRYLAEHPRASEEVARQRLEEWATRLKLAAWVRLETAGREVRVVVDEAALQRESRLDGCYALKTDVPKAKAEAETIHARYKDLKWVERAFRTQKTGLLEIRPVWLRREARTRAHVFVVMLAYRLIRELGQTWKGLDVTVEEGLRELSALCLAELRIGKETKGEWIPQPSELGGKLLEAAGVELPTRLPWKPETGESKPAKAKKTKSKGKVATRRKLTTRRK